MPSTQGILLSNNASIITVTFIWGLFFLSTYKDANMGVKIKHKNKWWPANHLQSAQVCSNHLVSVDAEEQNLNLQCEHQSFQFYVMNLYVWQLKSR